VAIFLFLFDFNNKNNQLFVLFLNQNKKPKVKSKGPLLVAVAGYAWYSYLKTNSKKNATFVLIFIRILTPKGQKGKR
jgi:hypothetical protein